jgi:hypothetical protein
VLLCPHMQEPNIPLLFQTISKSKISTQLFGNEAPTGAVSDKSYSRNKWYIVGFCSKTTASPRLTTGYDIMQERQIVRRNIATKEV